MSLKQFQLPYISKDLPGIGGKIKSKPEHFIVEEVPVYEPSGEGEHLFIHITKEGITTKEVQKALASVYKTKNQDVEFAGIKDKHAITSQYFSVWLLEGQDKNLAYELENQLPVKINHMAFHKNKIKMGHLLGNNFNVKITDIELPIDEAYTKAMEIIEVLHDKGVPNYYGEQRFGMDGDNAEKGYNLLKGKDRIRNKWLRRFLLTSYQSYLFNYYLTKRIENNLFQSMLKGDIAKKQDTGGIFVVDDQSTDQKRLENKEICFTGPIFGKKMTQAKDESGEFEKKVLEENEVTTEEFRKAKLTGTRRAGIILPEITLKKEKDSLDLRFFLPKGAFATVVLREIMKVDEKTI